MLLQEGYSSEELAEAKEILLCEVDALKKDNVPKISRRRHDSANKAVFDADDFLTLICYLDENELTLAKFVADDPSKCHPPVSWIVTWTF